VLLHLENSEKKLGIVAAEEMQLSVKRNASYNE
jgi:hypothetical protein